MQLNAEIHCLQTAELQANESIATKLQKTHLERDTIRLIVLIVPFRQEATEYQQRRQKTCKLSLTDWCIDFEFF